MTKVWKNGRLEILQTYQWPMGRIARLAPCCVGALTLILAPIQTPPAYSIDVSAPGISNFLWKIEGLARLSVITLLALTQTLPTCSNEVSTWPTGATNNCNGSNSDFGADLKRLSDTIKHYQGIPKEFLERHFGGCTFENARELLVRNKFDAEELGPEFDDSQPPKVVPREILTEKNIRRIGRLGSFNCRIILHTDGSKRLSARGFFYFDGP